MCPSGHPCVHVYERVNCGSIRAAKAATPTLSVVALGQNRQFAAHDVGRLMRFEVERLADRALARLDRQRCPGRDPAGQGQCLGHVGRVGVDRGDQAVVQGSGGRGARTRQQHGFCRPDPDQTRQSANRRHEAAVHTCPRTPCRLACDTNIAGERQFEAAAAGVAVHRRDHGRAQPLELGRLTCRAAVTLILSRFFTGGSVASVERPVSVNISWTLHGRGERDGRLHRVIAAACSTSGSIPNSTPSPNDCSITLQSARWYRSDAVDQLTRKRGGPCGPPLHTRVVKP